MESTCWFNRFNLFFKKESNILLSTKKCHARFKFKADQGRMCCVMCWGLQHFIAVFHNRKPGSHCLQGLKQQAASAPQPCDTDDMWPAQGLGARGPLYCLIKKRGEKKNRMHLWSPSISTSGQLCLAGLGLQFPVSPKCFIFQTLLQNVMCYL